MNQRSTTRTSAADVDSPAMLPIATPPRRTAPPAKNAADPALGRIAQWGSRLFVALLIVFLCFQGTKWLGTFAFGLAFVGVALDVYLTFRILKFPDLTIDGSFPLGACVYAAAAELWGWSPLLATAAGMLAGGLAGLCTGLLHTRLKIDGLLASIIVMIAAYTVNVRVMGGKPQMPLQNDNLITPFQKIATDLFGTVQRTGVKSLDGAGRALVECVFFGLIALGLIVLVNWFLHTELGLSIRATGDNEYMIRALGVNTDNTKLLVLALGNAFAGLCGALIAPYQAFADVNMGRGMIIVGLVALILGESLIAPRTTLLALFGLALGAVAYRVFYTFIIGLSVTQAAAVRVVLTALCVALVAYAVAWLYARGEGSRAGVVIGGVIGGALLVVSFTGLVYAASIAGTALEKTALFKLEIEDIELALSVVIVVALAVPGIRKSVTTRRFAAAKG